MGRFVLDRETAKMGLLRQYGTCSRCINQAFFATIAAWAWVVGWQALSPEASYRGIVTGVSLLVSGLLTANWILHVLLFAYRASVGRRGESDGDLGSEGKRDFIRRFGGAAAGVTAFSVFTLLSIKPARAQLGCSCGPGLTSCFDGGTCFCCGQRTHCGSSCCIPNGSSSSC
jgi:hypothetical protein